MEQTELDKAYEILKLSKPNIIEYMERHAPDAQGAAELVTWTVKARRVMADDFPLVRAVAQKLIEREVEMRR